MRDYIYYEDFNSITLARLAKEIGDYKLAYEKYSKALDKLRDYDGDDMQPIMMASSIVSSLDEIKSKLKNSKSILTFDNWKLTKSSYVKANQCLKYLYLDKYKRNESSPVSKETQEKFNQGHDFENYVRKTSFPDGINVKEKVGNFGYFNSYTKYLINQQKKQTIYEASIIEDEVLVMCDILTQDENGNIDIYEIKHSTELNEAITSDTKIQYAICKKRFDTKLNSFNLILRTENNDFKIENLTDKLEKEIENVNLKIDEFKAILQNKEPNITMGEHCNKPYECVFIAYCKKMC